MTDFKQPTGIHKLTLDKRENAHLTGVVDVLSFDDEKVVCTTDLGTLIMRGQNLHVASLNLDSGILIVQGIVDSVQYQAVGMPAGKKAKSVFGKIFK